LQCSKFKGISKLQIHFKGTLAGTQEQENPRALQSKGNHRC